MTAEPTAKESAVEADECSAARTREGYWTCDVPGGCDDCRQIARDGRDWYQFKIWAEETSE